MRSAGSREGEDACLQASWECPAGVSILYSPCGHPLERPLKRPVILRACWSAVGHYTVGRGAEWESFSCFKCSKIGRRVSAGQWPHMPVLGQGEICAQRLLIYRMLYSLQVAKVPKGGAFGFCFCRNRQVRKTKNRVEKAKHT